MIEVLIENSGLGKELPKYNNHYFTRKGGIPKLIYSEVLSPQLVQDTNGTMRIGGWIKKIITY